MIANFSRPIFREKLSNLGLSNNRFWLYLPKKEKFSLKSLKWNRAFISVSPFDFLWLEAQFLNFQSFHLFFYFSRITKIIRYGGTFFDGQRTEKFFDFFQFFDFFSKFDRSMRVGGSRRWRVVLLRVFDAILWLFALIGRFWKRLISFWRKIFHDFPKQVDSTRFLLNMRWEISSFWSNFRFLNSK